MAALSNYLESGLLHHIFKGQTFSAPSVIAIGLSSGVVVDVNGVATPTGTYDAATGGTCGELSTTAGDSSANGYGRLNLGNPASLGATTWHYDPDDHDAGSGVIRNSGQLVFSTALQDWGWVSGVYIFDNATVGEGNVLMHATLDNPRIIYKGDNVKFDYKSLEISFD
jgi:hypothetical protein